MGEFYVWNDAELGLAVEEMDKEHQELVKKMNALHDSVESKTLPALVLVKLEDLASYTVKHFADEEAYMAKIKFPELSSHKIIHQQLLRQFSTHLEEFKKTKVLGPEFFSFLKIWLTGHIRGIDMKYSKFSKAKAAS